MKVRGIRGGAFSIHQTKKKFVASPRGGVSDRDSEENFLTPFLIIKIYPTIPLSTHSSLSLFGGLR